MISIDYNPSSLSKRRENRSFLILLDEINYTSAPTGATVDATRAQFGESPQLASRASYAVHHLQFHLRSIPSLKEVTMMDSPSMCQCVRVLRVDSRYSTCPGLVENVMLSMKFSVSALEERGAA